jgi:toxin YoeB
MAKYELEFAPEFDEDFAKFKKAGDKASMKKIDALLKEVAEHPRTGTGKPEQLKGFPNHWSRRITEKHRLIYEIQEEVVIVLILSAYGHYDDE